MKELIKIIKEDALSYENINNSGYISLFIHYLKTPGFKVSVYMRLCKYFSQYKSCFLFYVLCRLKFRRLQIKYGIQIDYNLNVKGGFNINHYNGIVIHKEAIIGKNFSCRHNTTIGMTSKGVPKIGDNVYVGANVVIIGNIEIGDNCVVGAGSVVTKSFENNSIIAGNPAKIIKKVN